MRRTKPDIQLMADYPAQAHKIAVEGGMQLMEYFIAMALEEAKSLINDQKTLTET